MPENNEYSLDGIEDHYGFIKDDYEPLHPLAEDKDSRFFLLKENLSVVLNFQGKSYQGIGEARLEKFSAGTMISLYGTFENVDSGQVWRSQILEGIKFYLNGKEVFGIFSGCWDLPDGKIKVGWTAKNALDMSGLDILGNDNTKIKTAIFHLFNFPDLVPNISNLNFLFDKWSINFITTGRGGLNAKSSSMPDTFYLTHVGVIEKTDGEKFKAHELMNLLMQMNCFFSFLRGGVCTIICPIGYNENEEVVWESLLADIRLSHNTTSWYSVHYFHYVESFFSSFMNKVKTTKWRDTLAEVIGWYGTINSINLDLRARIILLQTALERISYELVVTDNKLMHKEGYQKLPAADKLRILFSSLKIPLEIPSHAVNLMQLKKSENWSDMPQIITEIRNSIVHPEHKKRGKHHAAAITEATELAISYLELCILAICDYNGKYQDRLIAPTQLFKEKKFAPWVTDTQET